MCGRVYVCVSDEDLFVIYFLIIALWNEHHLARNIFEMLPDSINSPYINIEGVSAGVWRWRKRREIEAGHRRQWMKRRDEGTATERERERE